MRSSHISTTIVLAATLLFGCGAKAQTVPDPRASISIPNPEAMMQAAMARPTVPMPAIPNYGTVAPSQERDFQPYLIRFAPLSAGHVFTPEVEKILALPEDKIDVGRAALTFAKEPFPNIDVESYSRKIDDLVEKIKGRAPSPDIDSLLITMHVVLYKQEGFQYDFSPKAQEDDFKHYLNVLLDTKSGVCDSMTALYLAVAQRLGLRAYPVMAPSHIFVRLMGPGLTVRNIDPSSGKQISNEEYISWLHIPEKAVKSGAYLRTMDYREYLATFLERNGMALRPVETADQETRNRSIAYFEKAVELSPSNVDTVEMLRRAYEFERMSHSMHREMTIAASYQQKAETAYKKTEELGYTRGIDQ